MRKQLLIVGFVWPEPTSSAAGVRMRQLIQLFRDLNYNIHFVSSAKTSERAIDFSELGITTSSIELNSSSFNRFVSALSPDVVLFDRFMTEEQFGWRVTECCPNAIKLLDTEDFHGLRRGRELACKDNVEFNIGYLQNDVTKRELASMYRCDLSLMISEAEIDILTRSLDFKKELLHYLPFLFDDAEVLSHSSALNFHEREHFVTIGNFKHPPNFDAVVYLKNSIWPLIRTQLPEAELHIYGAYVSPKAKQLHNKKEGFLIKGFTENVDTVMATARLCLAPLRYGAGLKGKLVDAMKNGTPCIMSSVAAEGMFGEIEPNGYIEDSDKDFAEKAVHLYTNKTLWQEKSSQGFVVIEKRFTMARHISSFSSKLEYLQENLTEHRQNNFVGQMLHYHSLQSSKYMSKWIEEKNKS